MTQHTNIHKAVATSRYLYARVVVNVVTAIAFSAVANHATGRWSFPGHFTCLQWPERMPLTLEYVLPLNWVLVTLMWLAAVGDVLVLFLGILNDAPRRQTEALVIADIIHTAGCMCILGVLAGITDTWAIFLLGAVSANFALLRMGHVSGGYLFLFGFTAGAAVLLAAAQSISSSGDSDMAEAGLSLQVFSVVVMGFLMQLTEETRGLAPAFLTWMSYVLFETTDTSLAFWFSVSLCGLYFIWLIVKSRLAMSPRATSDKTR